MEKTKRYLVFFVGLFINSLGVSLITKAELGTSPISSIPYVLSLKFPMTLGGFTILFSLLLIFLQLLILRRNFRLEHLLQVPVSIAFGYFIDLCMGLLSFVQPQSYPVKVADLLIGCVILGFGVFLEVIADVVMLPGESFVRVVVFRWKTEFGGTKVAFDVSMTVIAAVLSFAFQGRLNGVREGTVAAAILVGFIARLFGRKLEILPRVLFGKGAQPPQTEPEERPGSVCVVIDRQYGSGGHDIGQALSQQMNLPFYDREIIQIAAGSTGYSQEFISQREEKIAGALLHDLVSEMYGYSEQTPAPTDAIFEAEAEVMRQAARKGDCVVVGRCADVVLKGQAKCLRVFLHAPLEYRVQRLMRTEGFGEKEARRRLRQTDRTRAAYYQYYTNQVWGAAWHYHLCIDTSLGEERAREMIAQAYRQTRGE